MRGNENTFVLDSRADGSSNPRLLYWFHTPPNVQVGRVALDEESIRSIEERNPGVTFDWETLLKSRPAPSPEPRGGGKGRSATQRRTRRTGEGRRSGRGRRDGAQKPPPAGPTSEADTPKPAPLGEVADSDVIDALVDVADVVESEPVVASAEPEPVPVPGERVAEPAASVSTGGEHPVVMLMGRDTLTNLVSRHAQLLQRITEEAGDPDQSARCRSRAERLDPERWVTIEDAVTGIERFEREIRAIEDALASQAGDPLPPAE